MKKTALVLQLILSLIFLLSAILKLLNPGLVEIILIDQGIFDNRITAGFIVRIFIAVEFSLGILFLFPYYIKRITLPATWILLFVFTSYLVYTGYFLGEKENCGCFGDVLEMSPFESIIKNIVIAVLSVILFKLVNERKSKILFPVTTTISVIILTFAIFSTKEINNFRFNNYTYFENKGRVDLTNGEKLLAVFSLDCEHCQETARELNQLKKNKNLPEIFVLFFSEGVNTVDDFNKITSSRFPYTMINAGEFFDLIGTSPPRIYWLTNGEIKKHWDNKIIESISAEF